MSTHLKIDHWAVVTFWIRKITFQIRSAKLKDQPQVLAIYGFLPSKAGSARGVSVSRRCLWCGIKIAESIALSVFVKTSNFLEILFSPDNQSPGFVSADAQLRCHCPMSTLTAVDSGWWGWLVKRWGGWQSCASTTFSSSCASTSPTSPWWTLNKILCNVHQPPSLLLDGQAR